MSFGVTLRPQGMVLTGAYAMCTFVAEASGYCGLIRGLTTVQGTGSKPFEAPSRPCLGSPTPQTKTNANML